MGMVKWLKHKYYEWHYRKHDDGICCCGSMMPVDANDGQWIACEGRCRSMKEYTITSLLGG